MRQVPQALHHRSSPRLPIRPAQQHIGPALFPRAAGVARRQGHRGTVLGGAAQRGELDAAGRQRLLEARPERRESGQVGRFATRAGVDPAIARREVDEQFRPLVQADNDGHRAGGVLAEAGGFAEEKLPERFNGRIDRGGRAGFPRGRAGNHGSGLARIFDSRLPRPIPRYRSFCKVARFPGRLSASQAVRQF